MRRRPTPEQAAIGAYVAIALVVAVGVGVAVWYFYFRKKAAASSVTGAPTGAPTDAPTGAYAFPKDPSLVLWLDASQSATIDNSDAGVVLWRDARNNGHGLSPYGTPPVLTNTERSGVDFTNAALTSPPIPVTGKSTVFVACTARAGGDGVVFGSGNARVRVARTGLSASVGTNTGSVEVPGVLGAPVVFSCRTETLAQVVRVRLDAATATSRSESTAEFARRESDDAPVVLGASSTVIYEVLVFDDTGTVNPGRDEGIASYLRSKWLAPRATMPPAIVYDFTRDPSLVLWLDATTLAQGIWRDKRQGGLSLAAQGAGAPRSSSGVDLASAYASVPVSKGNDATLFVACRPTGTGTGAIFSHALSLVASETLATAGGVSVPYDRDGPAVLTHTMISGVFMEVTATTAAGTTAMGKQVAPVTVTGEAPIVLGPSAAVVYELLYFRRSLHSSEATVVRTALARKYASAPLGTPAPTSLPVRPSGV